MTLFEYLGNLRLSGHQNEGECSRLCSVAFLAKMRVTESFFLVCVLSMIFCRWSVPLHFSRHGTRTPRRLSPVKVWLRCGVECVGCFSEM